MFRYLRNKGYADDILVILNGSFPNVLCDITQTALGIVERWCKEVNLPLGIIIDDKLI